MSCRDGGSFLDGPEEEAVGFTLLEAELFQSFTEPDDCTGRGDDVDMGSFGDGINLLFIKIEFKPLLKYLVGLGVNYSQVDGMLIVDGKDFKTQKPAGAALRRTMKTITPQAQIGAEWDYSLRS